MDHQILNTYNQVHYQQASPDTLDEEITQVYDLTEPVDLQNINTDLAWENFVSKIDEPDHSPKVVFWKPLLKVAAMIIVAAGMGLLTYQFVGSESGSTELASVTIDSGSSKKQVTLPDGSSVWMNQGSTITYPTSFDKGRNISFQGEGYFEITKSDQKFIIDGPSSQITVLGTAFNFNTSEDHESRVTVTEGTVAFTSGKVEKIVTLGQEGVFDKKSGQISLVKKPDVNAHSWRTGHFVFDDLELSEIAELLSKYYEEEIQIDSRMNSCKVTGNFSNQPVEEVLAEISLILSAKVTKEGESFLISGEGC